MIQAVQSGPLPDEVPAAALWWRLTRTLPATTEPPRPRPAPVNKTTGAAPPATRSAAYRWQPLADAIDPRLGTCPGWPGLAAALDRAQRAGYDVPASLPRLAAQAGLPEQHPARAMHYRLVAECAAAVTPLPAAVRATQDRTNTEQAAARLRRSMPAATASRPPPAVAQQPTAQTSTRQHLNTLQPPNPGITTRGPAR